MLVCCDYRRGCGVQERGLAAHLPRARHRARRRRDRGSVANSIFVFNCRGIKIFFLNTYIIDLYWLPKKANFYMLKYYIDWVKFLGHAVSGIGAVIKGRIREVIWLYRMSKCTGYHNETPATGGKRRQTLKLPFLF